MTQALLPCPFCGHTEPSFERVGSYKQSCIVVCGDCGARHESSDEGERNGTSWNCRAERAEQRTPPGDQPAILFHCGQIDSSGEQDDFDYEIDSFRVAEAFAARHPGQTIRFVPEESQAEQREPLTWQQHAIAWLRGKAAEQAQNNERWPDHAKAYSTWRDYVTFAQRLADELEQEVGAPKTEEAP